MWTSQVPRQCLQKSRPIAIDTRLPRSTLKAFRSCSFWRHDKRKKDYELDREGNFDMDGREK